MLFIAIGLAIAVGIAGYFSWPDSNRLTGACAQGNVRTVQWCLRLGVDPNTPCRWGWRRENEGQTPLTAAAQYGHIEVIRLLLRAKADPNQRDSGSNDPKDTPLSTAARHGQLEVCHVLLEAGADPNVPTNPSQPGEPRNWTALDWALQANQSAVADLLRQHGGHESGRRGKSG